MPKVAQKPSALINEESHSLAARPMPDAEAFWLRHRSPTEELGWKNRPDFAFMLERVSTFAYPSGRGRRGAAQRLAARFVETLPVDSVMMPAHVGAMAAWDPSTSFANEAIVHQLRRLGASLSSLGKIAGLDCFDLPGFLEGNEHADAVDQEAALRAAHQLELVTEEASPTRPGIN